MPHHICEDWTSHELVSTVAAFILKEWLGYRVELVRLTERLAVKGSGEGKFWLALEPRPFSQDVNVHQAALDTLRKGGPCEKKGSGVSFACILPGHLPALQAHGMSMWKTGSLYSHKGSRTS